MSNQILSKANSGLKDVEKRRKDIIRSSQDYIDFVNGLVKSKISNPLTEAIEFGKKKLREYNEGQLNKANEAKKIDEKHYTFLKTCESNMKTRSESCTTPELCEKLIDVINEKWPTDASFGKYIEEARASKNNFITLLQVKKKALDSALNGDVTTMVQSMESLSEIVTNQSQISTSADDKQDTFSEDNKANITSVRRTWKFEVVSEDKLPREFLSIDEKKVKAYLAANKDKFESGVIKCGVKFYIDSAPIIK